MRKAGVLLHISSLPNKYGIGGFGKEAYDFVDFLANAGQTIWQVLPIGPTSYGDSPYQSPSAFAFNPYFIDLEMLVKDGFLKKEDLPEEVSWKKINYGYLFQTRMNILTKAYANKDKVLKEYEAFKKDNDWLDDYAEFMVLKEEQEFKGFENWYDDFKWRVDHAMDWFRGQYKERIDQYKFVQYLYYYQWMKLKKYANAKGIKIMGDIPIYCAYDSADVWAHKENFQLDGLTPKAVAGCPPDAFTADGQLWGNPLYDYKHMAEDGYSWWIKRVKHSMKIFDMLRIDHFRGFAGYYSIPYGDKTARGGHWEVGPGYALFEAIKKACPKADIVAENLGFLTEDVNELLDKCGYPGMVIFEFELGDGEKIIPLKHKYKENNIIYTGTHDNQTIMSWYHDQDKKYKSLVDSICKIKYPDAPNLKIINFAMKTDCNYCIIPIQDYIGLSDAEGRVNIPSTASENWTYRLEDKWLTKELCEYMRKVAVKSGRFEE